MKLALLLHFYQPHNQQEDILNRIVNECYLPVTRGLLERPHARVTININSVLTELLMAKGYHEVIDNLKQLAGRGQIEFSSSAKYHAFLPLLPEEEVDRQIVINDEANQKYFGEVYQPTGFFPPEMAVNDTVSKVVASHGYTWLAVPQVAYPQGMPPANSLHQLPGSGLKVLFRNKRVSSLMLSAVCRSASELVEETQDLHETDDYWFCVMDAETFGHHRVGHEKFLMDVLDYTEFFETVTVSDLLKSSLPVKDTKIRASTWTNEEQDFWLDKDRSQSTTKKSFILWKDPSNPIHNIQWKLTNFVIKQLGDFVPKNSPEYQRARGLLDKALASDQYWWASAKPWWSLEMIEQGAYQLVQVVDNLGISSEVVSHARKLYREILDLAFTWQRTGYVRKMHLDNSGTYLGKPLKERTPPEWFNQLILEFEREMNQAVQKQNFEKAIKWRDAVIKISVGTDKYDVLHVVDELWTGRNAPWATPQVKPFLQHDWEEFSDFAKKHFLGRGLKQTSEQKLEVGRLTRKEFEKWKHSK